jgi:hypothetical protein
VALCRQRYSAGTFDVSVKIGLCGCLGENADEVEDGICSRDRTADTFVVKYIGLDNLLCFGRSAAMFTRPGWRTATRTVAPL